MTDPTGSNEHSEHGIDFERASFEEEQPSGPMACSSCEATLSSAYFTAGEAVVCEQCRYRLEDWVNEKGGFGRFAKAGAFGFGAAALGAVTWGVITGVSGYEFGIVAIALGWLIGVAVRAGTGGRGGRAYQFMAAAFTYLAIVSTYIPDIVDQMSNVALSAEEEFQASELALAGAAGLDEEYAQEDFVAEAAELEVVEATADPIADGFAEDADLAEATVWDSEELSASESAVAMVVFGALIVAFAMALPFLAGFENIIGLVIIGIALWQAWVGNRAAVLTIEGPFKVGGHAPEVA